MFVTWFGELPFLNLHITDSGYAVEGKMSVDNPDGQKSGQDSTGCKK